MLVKRLILGLLTILAVINLFFSLKESLAQPQIQSRLELYQTNLVLQALEFKSERFADEKEDNFKLTTSLKTLVGENPYQDAKKQYQKARQEAKTSQANLQSQLEKLSTLPERNSQSLSTKSENLSKNNSNQKSRAIAQQKKQLEQANNEIKRFIDEVDLNVGILTAQQGQIDRAREIWQNFLAKSNRSSTIDRQLAETLIALWSKSSELPAKSEITIKSSLDGWFQYRALTQLYQQQNRQNELLALQAKEQEIAWNSLLKLFFIAIIPLIGGTIGVVLAIFLIAQRVLAKEKSLLATNGKLPWQTPWNWEITWQVLIVGFFFIGQILLPLLFGISSFNPGNLSLRYKAVYVLISYLSMAASGLLVLYFSIKPYFPLPQNWFRVRLFDKWPLWSLGGYTIAIPLVVVISLLNQQLWQGQGGSNPLLFLALQAQDRVALAIFFITASIAAPIFEEIIFRGFLLPSLTRYFSVTNAILLSSLIFAIAHLSLSEVLPLTTLGIILGVVYTRSRNLFASMLLHSLWNSGTLISLFILGSGS
jgi:hypothetical protein